MELLRQGTDRLGEVGELRDKEGEFSLVSVEEFSCHSDEVAEVYEFLCEFVGRNNWSQYFSFMFDCYSFYGYFICDIYARINQFSPSFSI